MPIDDHNNPPGAPDAPPDAAPDPSSEQRSPVFDDPLQGQNAPPFGAAPYGESPDQHPVPWMPVVPMLDEVPPPLLPEEPPVKPPGKATLTIAIGVTAMVVLYTIGVVVQQSYSASFFAFPFFVAFIVAIVSPKHPYRNTAFSIIIGLAGLVALLREGIVCVLFALPLIVAEMFIGALCAVPIRRYIDTRRKKIYAVTTTMLIAIGWQVVEGRLDDPSQHPVHRVDSEVVIAAPPDRVFDLLTHDAEVSGPWPWMIAIGLPIPKRLVIEEPGPTGSVRMEFNHGKAHARVTAWEPGRAFAFEVNRYEIDDPPFFITRLGRGEHYGLKTERVDDWLTLREIRYTFSRDGAGNTVLHRSTVFQRHLAPGFYFGWLEQTIMQRGQDRLLDQIREKVEPSGGDAGAPVAQR